MKLTFKEIDAVLIHLSSINYPYSKEIVQKVRDYLNIN